MSPLFIKNVNPHYLCGMISTRTLHMRKMRVRKAKGLTNSPGLQAKLGRDPDVVPGTWRGLIPACCAQVDLTPPPVHAPCTPLPLQEVSRLEFVEGLPAGVIVMEELPCHQVPVSYSWSITINGALIQTNRQRQLLASKPSCDAGA